MASVRRPPHFQQVLAQLCKASSCPTFEEDVALVRDLEDMNVWMLQHMASATPGREADMAFEDAPAAVHKHVAEVAAAAAHSLRL